jgi:hypothetical protein
VCGCLSLVSVVRCQVEVSATGWSLVQRSPECGVSECDRETSIMGRPWPTGGCCAMEKSSLMPNSPIFCARYIYERGFANRLMAA